MTSTELLDEVYERFRRTGPEFDGFLSNHGPMAADALIRLAGGAGVGRWMEDYSHRLELAPETRWRIDEAEWRDPLGDASRLGDWLAVFARLIREEPWQQVLGRWWPRLLPGAAASATHGLIRTGHAVRALSEQVTDPRLDELGQALGYWAARWQPIPGAAPASGQLPIDLAFGALPDVTMDDEWGMRARLAHLEGLPGWSDSLAQLARPETPDGVLPALDALTDVAVTRYLTRGPGQPIMLVHSATAPRAAGLTLPALPPELWLDTYDAAWATAAAVTVAYPLAAADGRAAPAPQHESIEPETLIDRAVNHGDEHVLKFAEVALESHHRGNPSALAAGTLAVALIDRD